jgi:hypothetical protein
MFIYWLGNLNMGGGGAVGPALVSYVDPTQVIALPNDTAVFEVDPVQAKIVQ